MRNARDHPGRPHRVADRQAACRMSARDDKIARIVERLVEAAMGTCEPEGPEGTGEAWAHTRRVLDRQFTAILDSEVR